MEEKPLAWLHGEIKTPPLSKGARVEAGMALRRLQRGEQLPMPLSRPMPTIGKGCHELRIADIGPTEWRIIYHLAPEAIAILEVFQKKTKKTPNVVIRNCKRRLALFNEGVGP